MATIPDHYREMLEFAARNFQKILRAEAAEDANIVQKACFIIAKGWFIK